MERILDKSIQGLTKKWSCAVPIIYQVAGDDANSHNSNIQQLLQMPCDADGQFNAMPALTYCTVHSYQVCSCINDAGVLTA